ncbi:MAG: ABC transporter permease [Alphaproteobacteria bacterium]|nr:ABC transporter permease [Alphaproteobacteria bacterium]
MQNTATIFRREMASYFATPVAYVFIVIFLALTGVLTFYVGGFFDRNQADLGAFFSFHPWLYLFLIPALSMRLWAEERRSGTIEMTMTLPVSVWQAVLGKFLAAWCFTGIALALTFPVWITVNYLGSPDNGAILAGYLGSLFMAGGFLAIGAFISALTKNQVIAFVLTATACFLLVAMGSSIVLDFVSNWIGVGMVDFFRSLSVMIHFSDISKGVVDIRDIVYFASLIVLFLFLNVIAVDRLKGA